MKIRDIMTTNIEVAEPDDTLDEVAMMMRNQDVGAIPVVEDDLLIGIITDRDIVMRCVAEGKDPSEIAADEIISGDLETIEPDDDVEQARRIMSDRQIRRLPVVEDGKLVGMVSLGDLAVKTPDEELAADALENISEGVKGTERPQASERSQPKKIHGGGRQQASGRHETGTEGRSQSRSAQASRIDEGDRGTVDRRQRAEDDVQAIANRNAKEEVSRQSRVVPIRSQETGKVRHARDKNTPRKAG